MSATQQTPEERELEWVRDHVGAPRPARLGCSTIAHDRLGYCAGCGGVSAATEANGWRLLALSASAREQVSP